MSLKSFLPFAAVVVSGALAGCVIVDGEIVTDAAFDDDRRFETVYAASVDEDEITLRVYSEGCTNETFFDSVVTHRGGPEFSVGFDRIRTDYCGETSDRGQVIRYSFQALGLPAGADVTLLNPVGR